MDSDKRNRKWRLPPISNSGLFIGGILLIVAGLVLIFAAEVTKLHI